jgi:hypothetical protein
MKNDTSTLRKCVCLFLGPIIWLAFVVAIICITIFSAILMRLRKQKMQITAC